MRLGVIGAGVVGSTLIKYLKRAGHEVLVDDPPKGINGDLKGCEAIFVCVPVPAGHQGQETGILKNALKKHRHHAVPFFIRSTVLPKTCDHFAKYLKMRVYAMPEFLTERDADASMASQPIVAGVEDQLAAYSNQEALLSRIFPDKDIILMSNRDAELAKYAHNCMGALKVNFFNGIYRYAEKVGANYEHVLLGVLSSGYINATHTRVPGPDGLFGYGGKCFPENMDSLIKEMRRLGLKTGMLEACEFENGVFRSRKLEEVGAPPPSYL